MPLEPYLFFDGRCEEALEFYKKTLGAQVGMLMRFKEAPAGPEHPTAPEGCAGAMPDGEKVMHAAFQVGDATIMVSDGQCKGQPEFKGFALTLNAKDDADAKRLFDALSAGGRVEMPLGPTFFASSFGMLADKFGVHWMVITEKK